tara:strand:+ start:75 stop:608 length:534 start_codon:yes stop_codon:yes gene_type:complete
MANLVDSYNYATHDDYYTPKYAWENINHLIPKNSTIWEACMLNAHKSKSPQYINELGHNCVYDTELDCLEGYIDCDIIISNIPFSTNIKTKILKRFIELDKPFIIIMNSMNLYSNYIRDIFKGHFDKLQVLKPQGKIHFDKLNYETNELEKTKNCSFYCIYLCYKMDLSNEDLWLIK